MRNTDRRREEGAALLVAVIVLALMGVIGLSSLDTATRDRVRDSLAPSDLAAGLSEVLDAAIEAANAL